MNKIIVTSPHSLCDLKIKERNCDKVAKKANQFMSFYLMVLGFSVDYYYSDIHRSIYDLNRKISKKTLFRELILGNIKKNKNDIYCNFDIHSFPTKEYNSDVYFILNNPNHKINNIFNGIFNGLKKNNIKYSVFESGKDENKLSYNDIMNDFNDNNIPSLLIEFYENLSDYELFNICQKICDGFIGKN